MSVEGLMFGSEKGSQASLAGRWARILNMPVDQAHRLHQLEAKLGRLYLGHEIDKAFRLGSPWPFPVDELPEKLRKETYDCIRSSFLKFRQDLAAAKINYIFAGLTYTSDAVMAEIQALDNRVQLSGVRFDPIRPERGGRKSAEEVSA